jgi:predicted transposase YbfD/YdcC
VIALKDNQKGLVQYVRDLFAHADSHHPRLIGTYDRTDQIGKPRGIVERRICEVFTGTDGIRHFREQGDWCGLQSVARIQYAQKQGDEWITTQTRYFISSLPNDAQQLLRTVRSHWHIENKLHRVLDVTFRQDDSRIRVAHSPQNFALIQHIALNLLKKHPKQVSIRRKRMQSARNDDLRWQILTSFEH